MGLQHILVRFCCCLPRLPKWQLVDVGCENSPPGPVHWTVAWGRSCKSIRCGSQSQGFTWANMGWVLYSCNAFPSWAFVLSWLMVYTTYHVKLGRSIVCIVNTWNVKCSFNITWTLIKCMFICFDPNELQWYVIIICFPPMDLLVIYNVH